MAVISYPNNLLAYVTCLLYQNFGLVHSKGLGVMGKGRGTVCTDCDPVDFDPSELTWALVTLGTVTSCYLAICTCRCYPKMKEMMVGYGRGRGPDGTYRCGNSDPAKSGSHKVTPGYPLRKKSINPLMNPNLVNNPAFNSLNCGGGAYNQQASQRFSSYGKGSANNNQNYHHQAHFLLHQNRLKILQKQHDKYLEMNGIKQSDDHDPTTHHRQHYSGKNSSNPELLKFEYPVDINGKLIPYPSGMISSTSTYPSKCHKMIQTSPYHRHIQTPSSSNTQKKILFGQADQQQLLSGVRGIATPEPLLDVSDTLNSAQEHFENRLLDQNSHSSASLVQQHTTSPSFHLQTPTQFSSNSGMSQENRALGVVHSHILTSDITMNHVSHHQSSYPVPDM